MLLDCHNGFPKEAKQVRYLGYLDRLRYIPHDHGELPVERLTCLQELRKYIVQGSCNKLSAIRNLRNLRELEMWIFGDVDNHEESKNAKLNEKQQLKSLSLVWLPSIYLGLENTTYDLILDNLEPHANIRELEISHHMGLRLPFWIENLSVKNLVSLKLKSCVNWELLPSLGELVWLKYLTLENLPMLRQIGQSSHVSSSSGCMESFLPPNLDILIVAGCQELQELPILPPSLVHMEISDVGLTKFPRIGKLCSASVEIKSSQLPHNFFTDCSGLNLPEGSILVQRQLMGVSVTYASGIVYIWSLHAYHLNKWKDLEISPSAIVQS
uniref:R13L1/DRL21-like LRR repeat region domain-containing protein n=1 Tax=Arundo donax TaxID=35708 RepID=A0A0A9DRZ4_ARUDO